LIGRYAAKLTFVLIVIGLIGMVEGVQIKREEKAFSNHGLIANAEPAGTAVKGQAYQGNLVFVTNTGQTVTIPAEQVPSLVRESFRTEKNTQIKYLPEKPSTVRFVAWEPGPSNQLLLSSLLFVAGIAAYWILRKSKD
jgi:hypothetical protein